MKQQNDEKKPRLSPRGVVARAIMGVAAWLVVSAVVIFNVLPQKYMLKEGDIAPQDFWAPKDIEDTITTEQNRQAAVNAVQDIYTQDDSITSAVLDNLQKCFGAMDSVRTDGAGEIKKLSASEFSLAYKDDKGDVQFSSAFLDKCHTQDGLPAEFTADDVRYLVLGDSKVIQDMQDKVTTLVTQALRNGIKQDQMALDSQKFFLSQELLSQLNSSDIELQKIGGNLVDLYLQGNLAMDQQATDEARKKASDSVQPAIFKKGQNIAHRGDPLQKNQIQVLSDLRIIGVNNQTALFYLGIGAFTGLMLLVVWLYLLIFEEETFRSFRKTLLLFCIFVLTVAAMWPGISLQYFFLLNTAGALLIAVLIGVKPALIVNFILSLFAGIIASRWESSAPSSIALPAAVAAMAGGSLGLFAVRRTPHRSALMFAGILSGLASAVVVASSDLMVSADWLTVLRDFGYGLAGGLVSSILCLGTLPLWESIFRVVTPMRLMELANPNHPLLKRLLLEAPGTYHHSIVVGNLAESAAEAIGANPLLTRTGAYYHDVGKLIRPYFFTENQMGSENPHDSISPELSKRILIAHTKDGVELAQKFALPQQVQDIILEHHGTTPVMYFYHKAVKAAKEDETVSLDDYRYAGPKPMSRESAVIMLADSVEAAARALQDHSQEKLEETVQQIINMKLEDGQFDNCDLTMRDLSIISAEFRKVLGGIFHERVVYPAMTPLAKENGLQ